MQHNLVRTDCNKKLQSYTHKFRMTQCVLPDNQVKYSSFNSARQAFLLLLDSYLPQMFDIA